MSASADPLGLLADDIEDPAIAWCRRILASTCPRVSVTTADAVRRRIPQPTASSIKLAAVTFRM